MLGYVGPGDFCGAILDHPDAHFHVGLTRAKPYLADQYILHLVRGGTGHRERLRGCIGGLRRQIHLPFAVSASQGAVGLAGEGYGDFCSGVIPTPDGIGRLLLQDHVVGDHCRKLEFRVCHGNQKAEPENSHAPWQPKCFPDADYEPVHPGGWPDCRA